MEREGLCNPEQELGSTRCQAWPRTFSPRASSASAAADASADASADAIADTTADTSANAQHPRSTASTAQAYHYSLEHKDPQLPGIQFNDAYSYMDWLLTGPTLLKEIVLAKNLPSQDHTRPSDFFVAGHRLS